LFSRPSPPPNHLPRTLSDCTHPADALPYELRALEAVLAAAAKRLEDDAASLEGAAGPQFARLGAAVSRAELDRVRERKAALAALLARAAGVKQVCVAGVSGGWGTRRRVCRPAPPPTPHPSLPPSQALEGILGDDNAMDAMYLTRKADEEGGLEGGPAAAEAAAPAPAAAPDAPPPPPPPSLDRVRSLRTARLSTDVDCRGGRASGGGGARDGDDGDDVRTIAWPRPPVDPRDVVGCADLIDAYVARVGGALTSLDALRERAAAAEALARLDLDRRRNELVAFNMGLSMVSVSLALVSAVASIFGQNLFLSARATPLSAFQAATWSSVSAAALLLAGLLAFARRQGLLFIPSEG